MDEATRNFVRQQLDKLRGDVLEVGSFDVNGSVRDIVPDAIGTDMRPGKNVDVVCPAEQLVAHFGRERFDAVMSFGAFEHMADWRACLTGMWAVLKIGGWLVFTIASPAKGRHAYPDDFWRMHWRHVDQIFPMATDKKVLAEIAYGWVVQKQGDLPDLSKTELIPVK